MKFHVYNIISVTTKITVGYLVRYQSFYISRQNINPSILRNVELLKTLCVTQIKEAGTLSKIDDKVYYMKAHEIIRDDLLKTIKNIKEFEVEDSFKKIIDYNVLGGKLTRAMGIFSAYRALADPKKSTASYMIQVGIIACCIEILQCHGIMIDDIMDNSITRRGKLAWHKITGINAFYHGSWLHSGVYYILKKYFSSHPSYKSILQLFHSTVLKASSGQMLDTLSKIDGEINWKVFNMARYRICVAYKTGYFFTQLPISLAAHLACKPDIEQHLDDKVFIEFGCLFQAKNDFLDSFDTIKDISNQNDIRDGKCTWLIVKALELADMNQRKLLEAKYGINNNEAIESVKKIYDDLNLKRHYYIYIDNVLKLVNRRIDEISDKIPPKAFHFFIERFL